MQEKPKSNLFINFIIRAVSGMGIIFCVNQILSYIGISIAVGFNFISLLTSGILGVPGVILLYGILTYRFL